MISLERIEKPRVWDRRRRCVEADPAPSTRLVTDGSVGLGALALSKAKAIYCRGSGGQCKNGPMMTTSQRQRDMYRRSRYGEEGLYLLLQ